MMRFPVACRYLPGNHDIGDNPTAVGPAPTQPVTEQSLQAYRAIFGEDRWRFEAAGWCFIGLNSLIMNTGLASEAEQFDWLAVATRQHQRQAGRAVPAQAAFSECARRSRTGGDRRSATFRCRRASRLIEMLRAVDLRLVASGHVHQRRDFTFGHIRQVWAPSAGFIIPDPGRK